ncbi:MAG: metalloregulator ArsR/SmtB family transcription factor [Cyanobacteria bacterium]|nr:metalloregulator ArsR/SmtB family transcription factor [Cyanobacteriota bacterium]MDA0867625.1 metalloregulator ArsR/SmtB family transcription factor [Cyanobacteriota bacterium]
MRITQPEAGKQRRSDIDSNSYFYNYRNMESDPSQPPSVEAIAATFAALGQPSRLKIVRLLLSAHPKGLPAGEIQRELGIAAPTLSHHLDKLRQVGAISAEKDRQWIWYSVRSETLKSLIDFLYEECCTRNQVVDLAALEPLDMAIQPADCCD